MTNEEVRREVGRLTDEQLRRIMAGPGGIYSRFIKAPPRGWASTDDCGERREPARMEHHANRTWIRRGNHIVDLPIRASDESLAFGRDLCTARNAYFCTEEAELDRDQGEALRRQISANAERAARVVIDFLDSNRRSLAPNTLLACVRAIIETETMP